MPSLRSSRLLRFAIALAIVLAVALISRLTRADDVGTRRGPEGHAATR